SHSALSADFFTIEAGRRISGGNGLRQSRATRSAPAEIRWRSLCFHQRRNLAGGTIHFHDRTRHRICLTQSAPETLRPATSGFPDLARGTSLFENGLAAGWLNASTVRIIDAPVSCN